MTKFNYSLVDEFRKEKIQEGTSGVFFLPTSLKLEAVTRAHDELPIRFETALEDYHIATAQEMADKYPKPNEIDYDTYMNFIKAMAEASSWYIVSVTIYDVESDKVLAKAFSKIREDQWNKNTIQAATTQALGAALTMIGFGSGYAEDGLEKEVPSDIQLGI